MLVSSHANSRPHMLTYSTFKLTLSCSFHLLLCTHCYCVLMMLCMFIHYLKPSKFPQNKHEYFQVVTADITTDKRRSLYRFTHLVNILCTHFVTLLPTWNVFLNHFSVLLIIFGNLSTRSYTSGHA